MVVVRTGWVGNTVKLQGFQKRGIDIQVSAMNSGRMNGPSVTVIIRRPAGHRRNGVGCSSGGARNYGLSKRRLLLTQHHISQTAVRTSHLGSFWCCSSLSHMKHKVRIPVAPSGLQVRSMQSITESDTFTRLTNYCLWKARLLTFRHRASCI